MKYCENPECAYYDIFSYPNNSLRINDAYKKLLRNVSNVPIEKIEELTKYLE